MCIKNIFINRRNYKIVWICDSTYIISNAIVNNGNYFGKIRWIHDVCKRMYEIIRGAVNVKQNETYMEGF